MTDALASATDKNESATVATRLVRRWRALPTVFRFGLAGGTTQMVYLTVFGAALATHLPYMVGLVVAQAVTICYAFPVYRRVVFAARGPLTRQFLTFMGVWWLGVAMSVVGVPVMVESVGMAPFVAQLLVLIAVFTFSFLGHLRLTFRPRPRRSADGWRSGEQGLSRRVIDYQHVGDPPPLQHELCNEDTAEQREPHETARPAVSHRPERSQRNQRQ